MRRCRILRSFGVFAPQDDGLDVVVRYHRLVALNRRQVLFLVRFFVLLIVCYVAVAIKPMDEHVITPFSKGVTAASTAILNLMGEKVTRSGTMIIGGDFAVDIKNGCNGVEAMLFLCAAMFAFDAPMKSRIVGILMACFGVQLLNLVRIVSLFLLGRHRREWFEAFHVAIWQSVIFGAAVLMFVLWTTRVQRQNAAPAP
jgi:exosortase H (IPTLxxWG-CTERM-specific)